MSARTQITSIMVACAALLLATLAICCGYFAQVNDAQLASERNHFLLHSLRKSAEDFLATGMTPEQMPAMQDIIDREKTSFVQLMSIDLFSPAGRITYSTDPGALHTQVPLDWVEKLAQSGTWETQDPTQDQLGMRFENNLGRAAGGIVLTLQPSNAPRTLAQWQQIGTQFLYLTLLALACCAIALVGGVWQLHRSLHPYRHISRILTDKPTTAPVTLPSIHHSDLSVAAMHAAHRLQQEHAQTAQAMGQLQELDHAS